MRFVRLLPVVLLLLVASCTSAPAPRAANPKPAAAGWPAALKPDETQADYMTSCKTVTIDALVKRPGLFTGQRVRIVGSLAESRADRLTVQEGQAGSEQHVTVRIQTPTRLRPGARVAVFGVARDGLLYAAYVVGGQ